MSAVDARLQRLRERIREIGPAVVAFSGGIDSALVLRVAHDVLGPEALALTAASPSLPKAEEDEAVAFARELGARHRVVPSHEVSDPRYAANPSDRCFFCKSELYSLCRAEADALGLGAVIDGLNADDLGDHRP